MTIHWCGTGLSAIPGLRRLIQAGHEVTVWNRTLDKAETAVGDLTKRIMVFDADALAADKDLGRGLDVVAVHEGVGLIGAIDEQSDIFLGSALETGLEVT